MVLAALLAWVDLRSVGMFLAEFDRHKLPGFIACIVLLLGMFAYRWKLLLGPQLSMGRALRATALGLGGNMILPARGGDLLRIAASAGRGLRVHRALGALVYEKLLDLLAAAAVGLTAVWFIHGVPGQSAEARVAATLAGAATAATLICLTMTWMGWFTPVSRALAQLVRLRARWYRHLHRVIRQLESGAVGRHRYAVVALTASLWLGPYTYAYQVIASMIGVPLTYDQCLILVFSGAIGLAIPAAPSGIGTFHVALVSGGVLIGCPPAQALAIAIAIHASMTLAFISAALVAHLTAPAHSLSPWRNSDPS